MRQKRTVGRGEGMELELVEQGAINRRRRGPLNRYKTESGCFVGRICDDKGHLNMISCSMTLAYNIALINSLTPLIAP